MRALDRTERSWQDTHENLMHGNSLEFGRTQFGSALRKAAKMTDHIPKNGEFLDGKLWFVRKGSVLTLGLTNVAVEEVGEVEMIEFPNEGDDFDKGDVVLTVGGSTGKLDVITPAAGVVNEVNQAAQEEPDMVSEDPLEEGWLIKIEIQDSTDLKEFQH